MRKIYPINFKIDKEEKELLEEYLEKVKKECDIEINRSDFLRGALMKILRELKSGNLTSAEFILRSSSVTTS